MRRTILLLALVLLASPAGAEMILLRDFSSFVPVNQNTIVPGTNLVFNITADSGPTFEWTWQIPAVPGTCCSAFPYTDTITEANAAAKGINWSALETALIGNRGQGTQWGPAGHETTTDYLHASTGYISAVDLSSVQILLNQYSTARWGTASLVLNGTFTGLAPEPSAFVLFAGCLHGLYLFRRR